MSEKKQVSKEELAKDFKGKVQEVDRREDELYKRRTGKSRNTTHVEVDEENDKIDSDDERIDGRVQGVEEDIDFVNKNKDQFEVVEKKTKSSTDDMPEGFVPYEEEICNQEHLVICLSHRRINPRGDEPGLKVFVCESEEEMNECYEDLRLDPRLTVVRHKRKKPLLLISEPSHNNQDYIFKKTNEVLNTYMQDYEKNRKVFKDKVKNKESGKVANKRTAAMKERKWKKIESARKKAISDKIEKAQKQLDKEPNVNQKKLLDSFPTPKKWKDTTYLKTRHCACIFIKDLTTSQQELSEPIFIFLAAFSTEDECKKYIKYTSANKYPAFNNDCYESREWLFPVTFEKNIDRVEEQHHDKELQKIMNQKKREQIIAKQHKDHCEKENIPLETMEVGQVKVFDKKKEKKIKSSTRSKQKEDNVEENSTITEESDDDEESLSLSETKSNKSNNTITMDSTFNNKSLSKNENDDQDDENDSGDSSSEEDDTISVTSSQSTQSVSSVISNKSTSSTSSVRSLVPKIEKPTDKNLSQYDNFLKGMDTKSKLSSLIPKK